MTKAKSETQVSKESKGSAQATEKKADDKLVQNTIDEIRDLYQKHHTSYLIEVGELIAENFFDGDWEKMRSGYPVKHLSFNKLCEELLNEDSQLPKKTWLYSAVNVYVDNAYLLQEDEDGIFQTYKKLLPSQRVELARIRNDEKLVEFMNLEFDKSLDQLSVRELRKEVSKFKGAQPATKSTVGFNQKVKSIHKQVEKWQEQIDSATIEGSADKIKKFKKLQTVLRNVLKSLDDLSE